MTSTQFLVLCLLAVPCAAVATPAAAAVIDVRAGDNLQAAINAAQPGDVIQLESGATFRGNFTLPVKPGAAYITIRTSGQSGLPGSATRITPAHSPLLARIQSPNSAAALHTAPGAHHWRLQLLEFRHNDQGYGDIVQIGDGSSAQSATAQIPYAIELDRVLILGHPVMGQKRGIALNAADVTIRNCYIADIKAVGMDAQAIGGWNGPGPYLIENNYLEASGENIMFGGADPWVPGLISRDVTIRGNHIARPLAWRQPFVPTPQAVQATVTAGPLAPGTYQYFVVARRRVGGGTVARSSTSATATAVVPQGSTGGVTVSWQGVPDAFEYRVYGRTPGGATQYWAVADTTFTDAGVAGVQTAPPPPDGDRWLVKNLFELKNAQRVVVQNNLFENNWAHGQSGYAIMLTPRNQSGTCTWCTVEDVIFQGNVVRHTGGGINISGNDDLAVSGQAGNIHIRQNLFTGIDSALGANGWFMHIGRGPRDIVVEHNTIDGNGSAVVYISGPERVSGFKFTNNAARHSLYGINGSTYSFGNEILMNHAPGFTFSHNWLQGGPSVRYPAGNLFNGAFDEAFVDRAAGDYRARAGSVLSGAASDGTDIGADMAVLLAATATASGGITGTMPAPGNLRITIR